MKPRIMAFTLIELLVVIAVIIVLAALLFPALSRSKIAADSIACRSNLRQMGIGLSMYVQQEHVYPQMQSWPYGLSASCGAPWPTDNYIISNSAYGSSASGPYLGPRQSIFACPGYNRVRGLFWFHRQTFGAANVSFGSYAYNCESWLEAWGFQPPPELSGQGLGGVPTPQNAFIYQLKSENAVLCPSDMIAFGDSPFRRPVFSWDVSDPPNASLLYTLELFPNLYNEVIRGKPADGNDNTINLTARRHGARWNVSFCDGHVENLRAGDLFDFSNAMVARRWNSDHQPHNVGWVPPRPQ